MTCWQLWTALTPSGTMLDEKTCRTCSGMAMDCPCPLELLRASLAYLTWLLEHLPLLAHPRCSLRAVLEAPRPQVRGSPPVLALRRPRASETWLVGHIRSMAMLMGWMITP